MAGTAPYSKVENPTLKIAAKGKGPVRNERNHHSAEEKGILLLRHVVDLGIASIRCPKTAWREI